jgi:hypothetical protein
VILEGDMENSQSKDDGYALPEEDDWAPGDSPREHGSCGLHGSRPRRPVRIRARKRATFLIIG